MIQLHDNRFFPAITFDDIQIIPQYSDIESRSHVSLKTRYTKNYSIDIPLIASPMDTVCEHLMAIKLAEVGGVGIIHRFNSIQEQTAMTRIVSDCVPTDHPVTAAVGATGDYMYRASSLISAGGAKVLLIDVAHGFTKAVGDTVRALKKEFPSIDIIAGNVADGAGVKFLIEAGADAVRVGVGGGSVCETRIRTGVGIPQISSLLSARELTVAYSAGTGELPVPIISCGGIRTPGDVCKALAVGAETVILGSLFAGTDESPGEVLLTGTWPNRKKMKVLRGAASDSAKFNLTGATDYTEGNAALISSKGSVATISKDICDGIRSAMTYVGANNIPEFQANAMFVTITNAGMVEAGPHILGR